MITTYLADKVLDFIIGNESSITDGTKECWLGFSTTTPNIDGTNFREPDPTACPSYERVRLHVNSESSASKWTNKWGTVANAMVENNDEICTNECLEESGWGTFTHFGLFDSAKGGKLLAFDLLTDPDGVPDADGRYPAKVLKMEKNHVAVFRAGTLRLKFC